MLTGGGFKWVLLGCFIWAGIFNDPFQTFVSAEMIYQAEKYNLKQEYPRHLL